MIEVSSVEQAGALPYQMSDGSLKVMMVQSKTSKRWIFPKGNLEAGLSPSRSAFFEAYEEAGVLGEIETRSIGSYKYTKQLQRGGDLCHVRIYAMAVSQILAHYPERAVRPRQWISAYEAIDIIEDADLKRLMTDFIERF